MLTPAASASWLSAATLARTMRKEGQLLSPMKTALRLFALLLTLGFPCVAFAELLGVSLPRFVYSENSVSFFCVAFFALLLIADYARRPQARRAAMIAIDPNSPPSPQRRRERHRLAA